MRIETREGAARYRGGWMTSTGLSIVVIMLALMATNTCTVVALDSHRDRIAALERQTNGEVTAHRAQIDAGVPVAYAALVARLRTLEADVEVCHRRWAVTDATLDDFFVTYYPELSPAVRRRPLPVRPASVPPLPADFCGVVATLPDARSYGDCRPALPAPTVPRLPERASIPPVRAVNRNGGGSP